MYIQAMKVQNDILIIGGGLAGLTCAIHLAKAGIPVTLIEKERYPRHKVCGEYISSEVLPYFQILDIDPFELGAVSISKFQISTSSGNILNSKLPQGGFGISRYTLDHYLWEKAAALGVELVIDRVAKIETLEMGFRVKTGNKKEYTPVFVIGAYGKRSSLENQIKIQKSFTKSPWLAIKSHYKADFDPTVVALHNFEGGYCGLSKVENGIVNACYLVDYKSFQQHKDIETFQNEILCSNPRLSSFFENATPTFSKPLSIAQINFERKEPVVNGILMVGDAAGLIHPLCGNGMAMAIHSAKIVSDLLVQCIQENKRIHLSFVQKEYAKRWNSTFRRRLMIADRLQFVLTQSRWQEMGYSIGNMFPQLIPKIIKQTHGKPIVC